MVVASRARRAGAGRRRAGRSGGALPHRLTVAFAVVVRVLPPRGVSVTVTVSFRWRFARSALRVLAFSATENDRRPAAADVLVQLPASDLPDRSVTATRAGAWTTL